MSFKCPDCGATLTDDSRFCKYCGAKIDDGVKRAEIKIDINERIENVAEVKRAAYEERESDVRVQRMRGELVQQKVKRIAFLVLLAACAVLFVVGLFVKKEGQEGFSLLSGAGIIGAGCTIYSIVAQMVKGKW